MSNDQLIAIKLAVIAAYALIGWLWMAFAAGLHSTFAGDGHIWERIGQTILGAVGEIAIYWWVVGVCSVVLFYISSTSIFVAIGLWMPKHEVGFTVGVAALFLHAVLAMWDAYHDWRLRPLWMAYGYILAFVIAALCFLVLRKAHAADGLAKPLFLLSFVLWVIYVGASIVFFTEAAPTIATNIDVPLPALALLVSLLPVPLASTAVAPLALASYRHG